jgi:hypothetical protein
MYGDLSFTQYGNGFYFHWNGYAAIRWYMEFARTQKISAHNYYIQIEQTEAFIEETYLHKSIIFRQNTRKPW